MNPKVLSVTVFYIICYGEVICNEGKINDSRIDSKQDVVNNNKRMSNISNETKSNGNRIVSKQDLMDSYKYEQTFSTDNRNSSSPSLRLENTIVDSAHDYICFLFLEDEVYYSGVLIERNIVATYQAIPLVQPKICFMQGCDDTLKPFNLDNFQFWKLFTKRTRPSLYTGIINDAGCFLPPELGQHSFVNIRLLEEYEDTLECLGSCMSGDGIICANSLAGMLTERVAESIYNYVTVQKLRKLAGLEAERKAVKKTFNTEAPESPIKLEDPAMEGEQRQKPEPTKDRDDVSVRRSACITVTANFTFIIFCVLLISLIVL